jgi:uracil-DNA glycosylase
MNTYINADWDEILEKEFKKDYFKKLSDFIDISYEVDKIYPEKKDIFNALSTTSYEDTKVVILGQDPYIRSNQAHGFAFSVLPYNDIPPSLMNIFKELENELNLYVPNNGCLLKWAKQGVLLLNSILTVKEGMSNSHKKKGWEEFTDFIIQELNKKDNLVFLLWGNYAQKKGEYIDRNKHLVLEAAHPSPLAGRRFFGCDHFKLTNEYLKNNNKKEIDWQIENIKRL